MSADGRQPSRRRSRLLARLADDFFQREVAGADALDTAECDMIWRSAVYAALLRDTPHHKKARYRRRKRRRRRAPADSQSAQPSMTKGETPRTAPQARPPP
jgi:hypothetical protein